MSKELIKQWGESTAYSAKSVVTPKIRTTS